MVEREATTPSGLGQQDRSLLPERAWRMPAVLRTLGLAADAAFGTGPLSRTGPTPNG
jgi:hypothetical protein